MKHFAAFLLCFLSLIVALVSHAQNHLGPHAKQPLGWDEDVAGRARFEQMMLANPATGKIPIGMRARELKYAATLPSREGQAMAGKGKFSPLSVPAVTWEARGPENVGGRTLALGIDVANENIMLAGSTSGGMWRSTDQGLSWVRTTPLNQIDNISALAQDTRPGKTNTWYYATGEPLVASIGEPIGYGEYVGNGLFKSTDDGITWNILPGTVSPDSVQFASPFNWVNRVVTDPTHSSEDIVYAATMGGIERSSDGGNTWTMTLGAFPNGSMHSDIAITSNGILYAVLAELKLSTYTSVPTYGVFRSVDGIHWSNITPPNWQTNTDRVYIATAPSDSNIMYVTSNNDSGSYRFWKYTYNSGDGSGMGGTWEDRTSSLVSGGVQFGGLIHVHPQNPNIVYIGEIYLWRSTDGFATANNITNLNYYNGVPALHVDHEAMSFFPSSPDSMIIGCDGGLYFTSDDQASQITWTSLNNNYVTAQFFSIAVDHYVPGDIYLLGGTQDNESQLTGIDDESQPWVGVLDGDGQACAIAGDRNMIYGSWQSGNSFEVALDGSGFARINPTGGSGYPWQNPFVLDPKNSNRMYFGGGRVLWRNDQLSSIPLSQTGSIYDTTTTSVGWTKLTISQLPANSPYGAYSAITAIGASTNPPNRVYYGTNDGMLFRLDSAETGNPKMTHIWSGKGFPQYGFISSIAVDPNNADSAIVVFANFEVQSLFLTTNGGTTWQPIGGNLEEYPDGSGNGPSVRAAAILPVSDGIIYLVGTSTGVYSTNLLNGMSTVWSLEGASTIGNDIINALDVRPSDGYVAVGSCGSGAYTATFTSAKGAVAPTELQPSSLELEPNYPNPYSTETHFEFKIPETGNVSLEIYDTKGTLIASVVSGELNPGTYTTEWDAVGIPNGAYLCRLAENGHTVSRLIAIER